LSPEAFGAELGVNRRTVIRLIDAGEVRAIKVGRTVRIPRSELERVLAGNARQAG
jgi:excisionase family DNA binding protein